MSFEHVKEIAQQVGGTIERVIALPDGSGGAVMSMALPKDHWIYGDPSMENSGTDPEWHYEPPPMVFKMGTGEIATLMVGDKSVAKNVVTMTREAFAAEIRKAAKYAVRSSTMKGKEMDFDPDALVQNMITGMLGYWTEDGLSNDAFANPGVRV